MANYPWTWQTRQSRPAPQLHPKHTATATHKPGPLTRLHLGQQPSPLALRCDCKMGLRQLCQDELMPLHPSTACGLRPFERREQRSNRLFDQLGTSLNTPPAPQRSVARVLRFVNRNVHQRMSNADLSRSFSSSTGDITTVSMQSHCPVNGSCRWSTGSDVVMAVCRDLRRRIFLNLIFCLRTERGSMQYPHVSTP